MELGTVEYITDSTRSVVSPSCSPNVTKPADPIRITPAPSQRRRDSAPSIRLCRRQLSALPFDRRCRQTLAELIQGWKGYLAIRHDVIAQILVGQNGPALALDLGQAHPAFERVKQKMTTLRQKLDQSASAQLTYVTRAFYRTCL